MASYVVAASLFIIGSSYLIQFVVEPPGSATASLEHAALRTQGVNALDVLLGSQGVPANWDATDSSVDGALRIGLIEEGTSIRIDPSKFDAIARGKLETSSSGNGAIDYAELKGKLGLEGYDFHIRAYPLISPSEAAPYGVSGYEDFEVAYVGNIDNGVWAEEAKREAHALDILAIPFKNATRASDPTAGDVYMDASADIRDNLMPHIGNAIQQTIISSGSGTKYSFYRVNASTYDPVILTTNGLTGSAMALSEDGGAVIGYNKNRELRTIVGTIDMRSAGTSLSWNEWVDTDRGNGTYDCGDYGYVELSADNGTTWQRFDVGDQRSRDCSTTIPLVTPFGTAMKERTLDLDTLCGATCDDKGEVLLAFHWVSDNDNNVGYGWVVDDVHVTSASDGTLLRKTFESPTYSMLIIGSNVDHNAFTPEDVKQAVRDYVDLYGGRILVVGGTPNANWLMRLFDVGVEGGSGGISTPDVTHPLLTLPNELDFGHYVTNGKVWDFSGSDDSALFHMVTGTSSSKHVLSVSQQGAWGESSTAEGAVILTTYLPYQLDQQEMRRFFANNIVYGKYHYLYLEVGPTVPEGEAVGSATRTATMNMYRDGSQNYTEMAFIMYVWPGGSVASSYGAAAIDPSPPRDLVATPTTSPAGNSVTLTWRPPASNGTGNGTFYHVYRGTSPTTITTLLTSSVTYNWQDTSATYTDATAVNGVTYYYNVTLMSTTNSLGTPSDPASATPIGKPDAPATPQATGTVGHVNVTWTLPASTGGGTIFGYALYANATSNLDGDYWKVGEIGNVTEYWFPANSTDLYAFKVAALNAWGWSDVSTRSAAAQATAIAVAPTLTVAPTPAVVGNTLQWVAPSDLGTGALNGYNVWRNISTSTTDFHLLTYINNAANVSFIDLNATPRTTYSYKVQAVTSVGDGLNSTIESSTTGALATAPSLSVVAGTGPANLTITYSAPGDLGGGTLSGYRLYRSTSELGAYTEIAHIQSPVPAPYTDTALGAGATRYYKIAAVTEFGTGDLSEPGSATTYAVPSAPTGLTATTLLTTTTITWVAAPSDWPVVRYDVYRGLAEDGSDAVFLHSVTVTATTDDNGAPLYYYRVKAVSAAGTSAFSNGDLET